MKIAQTPPMGWNSWNTFGENINDELIRQMADRMVDEGYLAAGYEYLVIDDCWALRQRNAEGCLVPDPAKFPHGMKALADYVHGKGLKFGIYSCAGVKTCAGYPGSFDHEYQDARTFAEWGVDFLKYDFCHFAKSSDCKTRYLTMSMALKASGRSILFSACNWGDQQPWHWMRQIGAHMYRSTGDIFDNYRSFSEIAKSQFDLLAMNGQGCFNDLDMLTVGMGGQGNVGLAAGCTYEEYRLQFAIWCMCGVPLMMGADLRDLAPEYRELMQNKMLLRINQDEECRAPFVVRKDDESPAKEQPNSCYLLFRQLSDGEFALCYINFTDRKYPMHANLVDLGMPSNSCCRLEMTDALTGEHIGVSDDVISQQMEPHDCKVFLCKAVQQG